MRQLFLKIFLSVLTTVLLTFAGGIAIAIWLMPVPIPHGLAGREGDRRWNPAGMRSAWRARMTGLLDMHVQTVKTLLRENGPIEARNATKRLATTWDLQTRLFRADETDRHDDELSPTSRRLVAQALGTDDVQRATGATVTLAARLRTADGTPFILVAESPTAPIPPPSTLAWMAVLRLGAITLSLGLVCYLLARYITNPVLKLRTALRRFAQGQLDQRVAPTIGTRRDEIGQLARDFDHMAERIATLLASQRRLLQDISHELRSPLARQRVALELIRRDAGPDAARALNRAEREAERLEELIRELLTLTRLESETDGPQRSQIDLAALIREIIDNAAFEACNGTRSVQLVEGAPCRIVGIPELVRRAIENVVRNALSHTADETIVEVRLEAVAAQAIVRVHDRGPGVPEPELAEIFRPFYRVDGARERGIGGVGLGLAIAARAIHMHGGQIRATNHPTGGLAVEIRLPRATQNGS